MNLFRQYSQAENSLHVKICCAEVNNVINRHSAISCQALLGIGGTKYHVTSKNHSQKSYNIIYNRLWYGATQCGLSIFINDAIHGRYASGFIDITCTLKESRQETGVRGYLVLTA